MKKKFPPAKIVAIPVDPKDFFKYPDAFDSQGWTVLSARFPNARLVDLKGNPKFTNDVATVVFELDKESIRQPKDYADFNEILVGTFKADVMEFAYSDSHVYVMLWWFW